MKKVTLLTSVSVLDEYYSDTEGFYVEFTEKHLTDLLVLKEKLEEGGELTELGIDRVSYSRIEGTFLEAIPDEWSDEFDLLDCEENYVEVSEIPKDCEEERLEYQNCYVCNTGVYFMGVIKNTSVIVESTFFYWEQLIHLKGSLK